MEVVLLWLDELDDLVFAGLLCADRLRPSCLAVGLAAALLLQGAREWDASFGVVLALANVSLASVVVWSAMSVLGLRLERRIARSSPTA